MRADASLLLPVFRAGEELLQLVPQRRALFAVDAEDGGRFRAFGRRVFVPLLQAAHGHFAIGDRGAAVRADIVPKTDKFRGFFVKVLMNEADENYLFLYRDAWVEIDLQLPCAFGLPRELYAELPAGLRQWAFVSDWNCA